MYDFSGLINWNMCGNERRSYCLHLLDHEIVSIPYLLVSVHPVGAKQPTSQTKVKDFITEREVRTYSHVKRRQQTMMMDAVAKIAAISRQGDASVLSPDGRNLVERIQDLQNKLLEFQHEKRIKAKAGHHDQEAEHSKAATLARKMR
jgi:hypothetical protein